jgi:multiple sugar transport system permease protein
MSNQIVSSARMLVGGKEVSAEWVARRRWAKAGILYFLLIFFSIIFMGPLLVAAISSLKVDPLEYPPRLNFEEIRPSNWGAAWKLGLAGNNNPWTGGFAPGARVPFSASYLIPLSAVPEGTDPKPPVVNIPKLRPGAGAQVTGKINFAGDYAKVEDLKMSRIEPALMPDGKTARKATFDFVIIYPKDAKNVDDPATPAPTIERAPMTLEVTTDYLFTGSTLEPSRLERVFAPIKDRPYAVPLIQSFINITPGVTGYVFRNYFRIFEEARSVTTGQSLFFRWILNSFGLVILSVISTLIFASMAGYALARLSFPGKNALFIFLLFVMTVPNQVMFISNYLVLRDLKLLNSILGVWLISGFVGAGQVFLMKQFFEGLPREVEEAAKIDGASIFQTFWRVIMPLAGPALGALTITTAQGAWNQYFWSLIVLTQPQDNYTLPIGLNTFNKQYGPTGDYGLILAGAIVSAIPVIILFVVFQRYFVSSVAFSGGKE